MKIKLGKRLIDARERAGLLQKEMAGKINITVQSMVNYELDKRVPPLETLISWAKVSKTSVGWLIGETEFFDNKVFSKSSEKDGLFYSDFNFVLAMGKEEDIKEVLGAISFVKFRVQKGIG